MIIEIKEGENINTNKIIREIIPQEVRVRKYEVDIKQLQQLLRINKKNVNLTNKQIAETLEQPLTLVEHWFRNDKSFAIPSEDVWFKLKELLNIEINNFDESIMTFEVRNGVYEKSNRVYDSNGIAPTLTSTSAEFERYMVYNNKIGGEGMNENKPILVGGVGEINFGKQYRQGNRIYDSKNIAMCLMSQPVGNTGGYSYLYKINNKSKNQGENIMKEFTNNLVKYNFKMDTIRLFDSFAGIGALHQSLTELGVPIEIVGMSEIEVDAIISYAGIHIDNFKNLDFEYPSEDEMRNLLMSRNIGWDFIKQKSSIPRLKKDKLYKVYKATIMLNNLGDISQLDYKNMIDFDLFNFSFPCTDISGAGKQKGLTNEDGTPTRSGLVKYGIEVIKSKKPKYIMIENVKALIQKKFIDDFYDIVNEIESYGYKCYYPKKDNGQSTCLNAKDYGIAQNRERIFVICVRNDIDDGLFDFPKGFDSGLRLKDFLEDEVDEKYYLDKPWHMSTELDEKHDTNEIAQIEGINYKATRSVTDSNLYCRTLDTMGGGQREPKVLDTNYFIDKKDRTQEFKETKNYIQWDTSGKGYTSQVDRAFYENGILGTIPAMNPQDKTQVIENIVNYFRIRKLTPKECWRLMGFRDECFDRAKELGISDSALYKQAGNSICVNVLYYIFKELFKKYIIE